MPVPVMNIRPVFMFMLSLFMRMLVRMLRIRFQRLFVPMHMVPVRMAMLMFMGKRRVDMEMGMPFYHREERPNDHQARACPELYARRLSQKQDRYKRTEKWRGGKVNARPRRAEPSLRADI